MDEEHEEQLRIIKAVAESDKRTCACGRVGEWVVCKHIFYGVFQGFMCLRVPVLYCDNCANVDDQIRLRGGAAYPEMEVICRHCVRLVFERVLSGARPTSPHYWFSHIDTTGETGHFAAHEGDECLDEMTPEERERRAGPYRWGRPGYLKAV